MSGRTHMMQAFDISQIIQFRKRVVAMANLKIFTRMSNIPYVLAAMLIISAPVVAHAQVHNVETYRDDSGWKLLVDGEDYYVKGVVWGYSPRGQNYSYNLWGESDDYIRKVLDYEFGLMAAAGVNTIRSFAMIPPEWVTYIYREHGIMTVVNPLMGRYGASIGGNGAAGSFGILCGPSPCPHAASMAAIAKAVSVRAMRVGAFACMSSVSE
jgi:hypothetical protein